MSYAVAPEYTNELAHRKGTANNMAELIPILLGFLREVIRKETVDVDVSPCSKATYVRIF